jgi:hypothetical protein
MAHKGATLTSGQKKIIHNVRTFFKRERDLQKSIKKQLVIVRTSLATGIGRTSVKKISREYREEGQFESPPNRYTKERVRLYPDDYNREALRRIVHQFY